MQLATMNPYRTVIPVPENMVPDQLMLKPQISFALWTNGVEELVDIDLSLFPCRTCTGVRLFRHLAPLLSDRVHA
jgi:hypothetical protein